MIYHATYKDGEYLQIVCVHAQSEEEARKKLTQSGWDNPIRLELLVFFTEDVIVIYNRLIRSTQ